MSPPPRACDVEHIADTTPACLRERRQWVCWKYVLREGKWTKFPVDARSGQPADSTDPSTWASFEEAVATFRRSSELAGIGFVFSADDLYCGIDLDDCIDTDLGTLKPWAQEIVERMNSYCEISPSGWGVKLFIIGTKPGNRCRRAYYDGEVEVYDHDRFFAVTGARMEEVSGEVEQRQAELEHVYHQVFGEQSQAVLPIATPAAPPADDVQAPAAELCPTETGSVAVAGTRLCDEQILEKAKRSRKSGTKFTDLWAGRWQPHFNSQSEADSSVVFTLAFYTKDAIQIDRMFRTSGLMRPKWDERHGAQTYGRTTIDNALAQVRGQWGPGGKRGRPVAGGNGDGGDDNSSGSSAAAARDWQPDHLSQQVNAERLVQVLEGDARYDVNKGRWLWYDGQRFADDHAGRVDRAAKRVARQTWRFVREGLRGVEAKDAFKHALDSEKAAGISAMMKLAQTEAGIPARSDDFDAGRYLFNCFNGTLDLATGTLRPHDRADLLTKVAPVAYDPAAARPLFDAFILRAMAGNKEMVAYLARVLGRCLTGDISEQELYFFLGEGANGKSVLVDTVLGILGSYAGTAPDSLLTVKAHDEHPTEIADLCGKRLVVASETEEGARLKVQLVKRLTGDGRLKGRFMRQDFFEFDRTHKLIIVSNNRPVIRETKHAIWRRIRLVPFDVIIPEKERDTKLTDRLVAEWPGILSWLVEGYRDWREGGMRTPKEVLVATQNYQTEQDPFGDYLADRCLVAPGTVRVGRNELFTDYLGWCQQTGEKNPLGRNTLFDRVRALSGIEEDTWRAAGQTSPVRGFRGIGLAFAGRGVADSEH